MVPVIPHSIEKGAFKIRTSFSQERDSIYDIFKPSVKLEAD